MIRLITLFHMIVFFNIYMKILAVVTRLLPLTMPQLSVIQMFLTWFVIIPGSYVSSVKLIELIRNSKSYDVAQKKEWMG